MFKNLKSFIFITFSISRFKMYYLEEEIASHLICPRCNMKFHDPRIIVPCFETLCAKCIGDLTDDKTNEIDCYFCHRKHPTPDGDGFASNKLVIQMLNLKANEFNTNERVRKLGEKLDVIKSRNKELESNMDQSRLIINKHCSEVKAKIDFLIESRKKNLDDMRNKLLQEVDAYEKECVDNLDKIDTKLFLDGINETREFLSDSSDHLKKIRSNDDDDDDGAIREMIRDADYYLESLETLHHQLKGVQFSGKLLRFKENESSDIESIGFLQLEKLETPKHLEIPQTSSSASLGLSRIC
jgi:hypothetical protein